MSEIPEILDVPIGLSALAGQVRVEHDSMGEIEVPADRYWGAQTQRSLYHFDIGTDKMPHEVHHAYGLLKQACAVVNGRHGRLPLWKADLIGYVCGEVADGRLDSEFTLHVWQTGSGTQSNMNVNEVIANRCIQLVGGTLGSQTPVHPNDDVNMGQSSNDTFPVAMHLAALEVINEHTLPQMHALHASLEAKAKQWIDVVKIGRTHLQDAVPITVGQEWSGYAAALADATDFLAHTSTGLHELAIGGTAVGTGLNAVEGFGEEVSAELARVTGIPFTRARNPFMAQSTLDPLVRTHAALKTLAVTLFKIANDVRWLGSGPRAGIGELVLPANEPGSSIMPGKLNPTQAEALLMVCIKVMGNDVSVQIAGAEGNFELNAFRPVVIADVLQSARLLADAVERFRLHMVDGTELDIARIDEHLRRSLMMVTALAPHVGYDHAARIAHHAHEHGLALRDAALALGVSGDDFDRLVRPLDLTQPGVPGE